MRELPFTNQNEPGNNRSSAEAESIQSLIEAISNGLDARGFHIADGAALAPLWSEQRATLGEKLRRLSLFAAANNWEVNAKDRLALVLFQPRNRRKMWTRTARSRRS